MAEKPARAASAGAAAHSSPGASGRRSERTSTATRLPWRARLAASSSARSPSASVKGVRGAYSESEYEVSNTGNMKVKGAGLFADWRIAGPHTKEIYVEQVAGLLDALQVSGPVHIVGSSMGGSVTMKT